LCALAGGHPTEIAFAQSLLLPAASPPIADQS
jgi:hypothetical protein